MVFMKSIVFICAALVVSLATAEETVVPVRKPPSCFDEMTYRYLTTPKSIFILLLRISGSSSFVTIILFVPQTHTDSHFAGVMIPLMIADATMAITNRDPAVCHTILIQPSLHVTITMCAPPIPSVSQIKCATTPLTIVNVHKDSTSPHRRLGASALLRLQSFLLSVLLSEHQFAPQFALLFDHQPRYETVTTPVQSTPTVSQIVNATADSMIANVTVVTTNLHLVIQHVSQTITKICDDSALSKTCMPTSDFQKANPHQASEG